MRNRYYDRKKQVLVAIVITTGKKKVLVVCLAGCTVVSVFGSGRKPVLVVHTAMYLEYHTVVVLRLFFLFWREIVFGVTYVLSVQYSCAVVSVFLLWRESFITTRIKKVLVICLAGCAVVSVFGSGRI